MRFLIPFGRDHGHRGGSTVRPADALIRNAAMEKFPARKFECDHGAPGEAPPTGSRRLREQSARLDSHHVKARVWVGWRQWMASFFAFFGTIPQSLPAESTAPPVRPPITAELPPPAFREEGEWLVLHHLRIHPGRKEIRLRVQVAITQGILEYLLVDAQGKTYESLFCWEGNRPSELQFALLLAGYEPVPFGQLMEWLETPAGPPPPFPPQSRLHLRLLQDGQPVDWTHLLRAREGQPLPEAWEVLFTGSHFLPDGRFAANLSLSLIAIWRDESAILNSLNRLGNPYRGDLGFEIRPDVGKLEKGAVFELQINPSTSHQ